MNTSTTRLVPVIVALFIVAVEAAISFNEALLPNIKADFVISDQLAQFTISGTLFALGLSGMVYGGLCDALGRRPLMLLSVSLFSISVLVSALTTSLTVFMLARVTQGFGSGAGWVVGNACLKDIYHGKDYTRVMNHLHAVAGIVPAVAPALGSYLAVAIGWKVCFLILFVLSLIAAVMMVFFQPETLPQRQPVSWSSMLNSYLCVITHRRYIQFTVIKVIAVMLIFCEASTLSLVFVDYMNVAPAWYGLYILPLFSCYILGNLLGNRIAGEYTVELAIAIGIALIGASNVLLLAVLSKMVLTPVGITLIKTLTYMGWGFIFGNATSIIVSSVPGKAGMSSALMIASEMLASSVGIALLGWFFVGDLLPLSWFMVIMSLVMAFALRWQFEHGAHYD